MPIIACIYKAQKVLGCGGDFLLFVPYSFFFIVDAKSMPGGLVYMAGSSPAMTVVGTVFRSQARNELASNAAPHNI
jgi:hypothetical protein